MEFLADFLCYRNQLANTLHIFQDTYLNMKKKRFNVISLQFQNLIINFFRMLVCNFFDCHFFFILN